ncbi:MAG TPA: hypothetical protein VKY74_03285 [Chloroflexia bacterium]|nr:hypothetical protein [Chloroflexia bacterium]
MPDEALVRLACLTCGGEGRRGPEETPCESCAGVTCPICRGIRWLRTSSGPVGARPAIRCPGCRTPVEQAATIAAFVAAQGAV